ncbi:MAG: D-aminoacyl-tRNA deacylase [Candidatus Micrarchaeia archaeon]
MKLNKEDKKGLVLFSLQNDASANIMNHLHKDWKWQKEDEANYFFSACGDKDGCTVFLAKGEDEEIIKIEPRENADYYLYASTHKSEKEMPALTAHFPGNWASADFGGQTSTLNIAFACKLKQILKFMKEGADENGLNWQINMEVDHHGPTPQNGKKKLIFVEIGSGEKEWKNEVAGKIVAAAIMKSLARKAPVYDTYLGIGGGHYTPKFSEYVLGKKLLDGKEIAISHILPKHRVDEIDSKMLLQAMQKSVEPIKGALIDHKGLNKEQREKIIGMLEKEKIEYKKV